LNPSIEDLSNQIAIYSDVKNLQEINDYRLFGWIKGFTTNPSLIRAGGAENYIDFIRNALPLITNFPFSVEVIADDLNEMKKQALFLNRLGKNVFVKIPITNTQRNSTIPLIVDLLDEDVKVNITAIMTLNQVESIFSSVPLDKELIVSIFFQAIECGIDIITATPEVLKKHSLLGKDLDEYSLETVKMFYEDATSAGYRIPEIDY